MLRSKGGIRAVRDVTEPERLAADDPLRKRENALSTPHLAGPPGDEWRRPAEHATAEVAGRAAGEGFAHAPRPERLACPA